MSLEAAAARTISGMNINQRLISIASQNIARANEDDYVRIKATIGADLAGNSTVYEVKRELDALLVAERRSRISKLEYFNTKSEKLSRAQDYLGVPDILGNNNTARNINSAVDKFFSMIQMLSVSPDDISLKSSVVLEANRLATMVSSAAENIEKNRYECDVSIYNCARDMNYLLVDLHNINKTRVTLFSQGGSDEMLSNLDINADKILKKLSEYIDITVVQSDNKYHISSSGVNLLNDNLYKIDYTPISSVSSIINDQKFSAMTVCLADTPSSKQILIPSGVHPLCEDHSRLSDGKIKALAELRDKDLPMILDNLDNLAYVFGQYLNETYSAGVNYPGKTSLVSNREFNLDDNLNFRGKVRFLPLDKHGAPVSTGNYDHVKPLEIDFSDPKHGKSQYKMADLINEINSFFTLGANRVELPNNIDDVRIATTLNSDKKVKFNFEIDNNNDVDEDFGVHNIKVFYQEFRDGELIEMPDAVLTNIAREGKFSHYKIPANLVERTKDVVSLDLRSAPRNINKFIIRAEIHIAGSPSEVDFEIDAVEDTCRYSAVNVVSGEGVIIPKSSGNRYVRASFVDEKGNVVQNRSEKGCLKLSSLNSEFRIVIDDINSSEIGYKGLTQNNFFHALGMNNMFTENPVRKNSALNMKVEKNLVNDYRNLNTGVLQISKFSTNINRAEFLQTGSIGAGNNLTALKLSNLAHSKLDFASSGNISQVDATFSEYSIHVISETISQSRYYRDSKEREELFMENIDARFNSISGVNINEELANMEVLERSFAAQSRVTNVLSDIHDSMMQAFS